jgi:hypothetical protein
MGFISISYVATKNSISFGGDLDIILVKKLEEGGIHGFLSVRVD